MDPTSLHRVTMCRSAIREPWRQGPWHAEQGLAWQGLKGERAGDGWASGCVQGGREAWADAWVAWTDFSQLSRRHGGSYTPHPTRSWTHRPAKTRRGGCQCSAPAAGSQGGGGGGGGGGAGAGRGAGLRLGVCRAAAAGLSCSTTVWPLWGRRLPDSRPQSVQPQPPQRTQTPSWLSATSAGPASRLLRLLQDVSPPFTLCSPGVSTCPVPGGSPAGWPPLQLMCHDLSTRRSVPPNSH